jgi:hypothetical protein
MATHFRLPDLRIACGTSGRRLRVTGTESAADCLRCRKVLKLGPYDPISAIAGMLRVNDAAPPPAQVDVGNADSAVVTYLNAGTVVQVHCSTAVQAAAVRQFAQGEGLQCPAPPGAGAVHACHATTHPNGEVLWG